MDFGIIYSLRNVIHIKMCETYDELCVGTGQKNRSMGIGVRPAVEEGLGSRGTGTDSC